MKFKNFEPQEIEVNVHPRGGLNAGGVSLWVRPKRNAIEKYLFLATKGAPWSSKIKDVCGNVVCTIKIGDISRSAAGVELFPGAGDAVKNAFVNAAQEFGIGWSLTTLPKIFIPKEYLRKFSAEHCYDRFEITEIKYSDDGTAVEMITIAVLKNYAPVWGLAEKAHEIRFYADGRREEILKEQTEQASGAPDAPAATTSDAPAAPDAPVATTPDTPAATQANPNNASTEVANTEADFFEQTLLIGKFKKWKIADVKAKKPKEWLALLTWAYNRKDYETNSAEQMKQFEMLKKLGTEAIEGSKQP